MIAPRPRSSMCGITVRDISHVPRTLTAIVWSQTSTGVSQVVPAYRTPALLKSTSIRPCRPRTSSTVRAQSSSEETSPWIASSARPCSRALSRAASRASRPRPVITTEAPLRANSKAAKYPRPLLPPVMSATLSDRIIAISPRRWLANER
jgi:hypothetical protein